ncbi:hypothetical protein OPV22_003436 [Ensete ventricosum]|uniref:Uncharacterized protein n=1 Tax=Ensete ventricosum TaxID=4639 RepID=A0AAV8S0L0_ENSVE|nr:hypothetical protein OPV22_003436 [Ensete ventricosum]
MKSDAEDPGGVSLVTTGIKLGRPKYFGIGSTLPQWAGLEVKAHGVNARATTKRGGVCFLVLELVSG